MTFHAFGLNFETAPVAVREAFALGQNTRRELLASLPDCFGAEVVLLSTCNRTEIYLFGSEEDAETVRSAIVAHVRRRWPADHAFDLRDEAAILHIIRVCAGVMSQVVGDAQILSQMKDAYRVAVEADRVGTVLHRLLHSAFRAAKRVRSETALTDGVASVSSAAVQAARLHFERTTGEGLTNRHVLLLGLGQMGISALRALQSIGVAHITLANRSRDRAEVLACEFGASVIDWEDRHSVAARADLVLVASGADEHILLASELPDREGCPALVVDVAVPRNVDPAIAEREGYEVVDIDVLDHWRQQTVAQRSAALPAAEKICDEALAEFVSWVMHHEALQPALHALRDTFDAIRRQAIDQHGHRFEGADREALEKLTESILQKLLAVPIVRLKATDAESLDFARGVRFLAHVFSRPGCDDASARTPSDALPAQQSPAICIDHLQRSLADASRDPR